MTKLLHVAIAFSGAILSQISVAEECPRIARAVIDLGSGSTKLTVAEVELCAKREPNLVKILEDSRSEAIALEAGKNPNGDIPDELQIQTVHAITKLKDEAREIATAAGLSRLELAIAGTHALRTARNRGSFLRRLEREGYSARALTQTQEGRFGFLAALKATPECTADKSVVWDIGGGSMQLATANDVLGLPMGAEGFKKETVTALDRKTPPPPDCPSTGLTPNPIGVGNIPLIEKKALQVTRRLVGDRRLEKFRAACVIGIGGVHGKAVAGQIDKQWPTLKACACPPGGTCPHQEGTFTRRELKCLIDGMSRMNDCAAEIKGPYASTSVSNLYFVQAWMDRMKVDSVRTKSINMGHFLVTDKRWLKFKSVIP